jgi:hypothetical protein
MLITGINADAWSNKGTNIFNDQDAIVAGHRHIRIVIRISF